MDNGNTNPAGIKYEPRLKLMGNDNTNPRRD